MNIPRLIIAGTHSGVGKTTVTVGLCRALRARGLRVAVFKCGPDYLDPTYHVRAAGRPCHNLDGWMMGRTAVQETFARVCQDADVALIEGVMGLFDGASPTSEAGSTAEIAKWLHAPVMLVVDASGMARSVAALAQGFAQFDPDVRIKGLWCNRVGSRNHLDILSKASVHVPVLGGLPKNAALRFAERHLGLHGADHTVPESHFDALGAQVAEYTGNVLTLAEVPHAPTPRAAPPAGAAAAVCRIAYAHDAAFHFYYEDNLRRLENLGAELVPFSPLNDSTLPAADGLYIGGGYPELHAPALAGNTPMRTAISQFPGPIYAECGGLMYLCRALHTLDGATHRMVGLLPAETTMCDKLQALGYVEVETQATSPLGDKGLRFRGHQFRYSQLHLCDDAPQHVSQVYSVRRRRSGATELEGLCRGQVLASYVHAHWASNPQAAAGLVNSCIAARAA